MQCSIQRQRTPVASVCSASVMKICSVPASAHNTHGESRWFFSSRFIMPGAGEKGGAEAPIREPKTSKGSSDPHTLFYSRD